MPAFWGWHEGIFFLKDRISELTKFIFIVYSQKGAQKKMDMKGASELRYFSFQREHALLFLLDMRRCQRL